MSRVQLALNVADLEASIAFYSSLFRTEPAKVRDGYANFAIADPPLKLVLIAGEGEPGSLNHLGVEVATAAEVQAETERLVGAGASCAVEDATTCCYAVQDKVWVSGPDTSWEIYTVLADAPVMRPQDSTCCASPTGDVASVDDQPVAIGAAPTGRAASTPAACC